MSSYRCTIDRQLWSAWVESALHLDPADYLECEDVDELRDMVRDELYDSCDTGDVQWKDGDTDIEISSDFITEWKSLKGLE